MYDFLIIHNEEYFYILTFKASKNSSIYGNFQTYISYLIQNSKISLLVYRYCTFLFLKLLTLILLDIYKLQNILLKIIFVPQFYSTLKLYLKLKSVCSLLEIGFVKLSILLYLMNDN